MKVTLESADNVVYIFRGEPGSGKSKTAQEFIPLDCLIAADDYPEFNKTGEYIYIDSEQKNSHKWCFEQYIKLLEARKPLIGVHNTFMLVSYMEEYIEAAIARGYIVKVIHCEAVILDEDNFAESTHNVPKEVIRRMRDSFQLMRPPSPGMSMQELAKELERLWLPNAIFCDWDQTLRIPCDPKIKFPKLGETIINPQIDKLITEVVSQIRAEIHIISNQRGLQFGHKTPEYLQQEYELFLEQWSKKYPKVKITSAKFAVNPQTYLEWENGKLVDRQALHEATKPGTGMIRKTLAEHGLTIKNWVIGNAHISSQNEDWAMVQKLRATLPEKTVKFRYIPIEMLDVAVNSVSALIF